MSRIRAALPADHLRLRRIKELASWSNAADRAFLTANPKAARQLEGGDLWVFEGSNGILGYAALVIETTGRARLEGLFVDPAHMRQGVGAKLVTHCAEFAQRSGASVLQCDINAHASAFYRKMRFRPVPHASSPWDWALVL